MTWRQQMNDKGVITRYKDTDTGETLSAAEWNRRMQVQNGMTDDGGSLVANPAGGGRHQSPVSEAGSSQIPLSEPGAMIASPNAAALAAPNPLVHPGAQMLAPGSSSSDMLSAGAQPTQLTQPTQQALGGSPLQNQTTGLSPTAGLHVQGKSLRLEGLQKQFTQVPVHHKTHGFLDATSIAILLPTLVLLALIIAAAH